jgi:hypothetical protein
MEVTARLENTTIWHSQRYILLIFLSCVFENYLFNPTLSIANFITVGLRNYKHSLQESMY